MGDWITTYIISFSVIPGGFQVNLGYATVVALAWAVWGFILKPMLSKRNSKA